MNHGDFSIIEHTYAQVEWLCDRGLTHEIVRHRLSAFTQESTRFVNYDKRMPASFIQPAQIDREKDPAIYKLWADAVCQAEVSYRDMVRAGIAPQIARSVLPTCTAAKLIMTCNLRMWRHFLLMRTTKEAHPQLRELTIPLLADFKARIPILFDDIEAEERQIVNMRKAR
jgi:thymidylate synthase (FAD)